MLVGEVPRSRGLALLAHPELTGSRGQQTLHELSRRGALMVKSRRAEPGQVAALLDGAFAFIAASVVQVAASEYTPRATPEGAWRMIPMAGRWWRWPCTWAARPS
ncbi:hypothetical protein GCM10022631_25600 [Deinococcus rubellus]